MISRPGHSRSPLAKVYVALGLLLVLSLTLFIAAMNRAVAPGIITSRTENAERLIRSNFAALELFDTRRVREELVNSGAIGKDQDFDIIRLGKTSSSELAKLTSDCTTLIGNQTCIGPSGTAVIFSSSRPPLERTSSFAIVLRNANLNRGLGLAPWTVLGVTSIFFVFLAVALGIRREEKLLLKKITLLDQASKKVPSLLGIPVEKSGDGIEAASDTLEQLARYLRLQEDMLSTYRSQLARQTRSEQLKRTLAQSAHDLRAPLEETADFLRYLPTISSELTQTEVHHAIASLETRVRGGIHSLDNALRSTSAYALDPRSEPFNLPDTFDELAQRFRASRRAEFSTLTFDVQEGMTSATVRGDPAAFQAMLWNLIENALQAKSDAKIHIKCGSSGGDVLIVVRDDGPGIPSHMLETIFEDFVTSKPMGTGLGLPSARQVANEFGGTLTAINSFSGAIFELRIPQSTQEPNIIASAYPLAGDRHV